MLRSFRRSIRLKVMLVVLVTTLAALLLTGTMLAIYDLRSHQASWVNDLVTQADIVGRASAPALTFQDTLTAQQNLRLLAVRPQIMAAAIYTPQGARFASYVRDPGGDPGFPDVPAAAGYRFRRNDLELFHGIADADERLGTVYLRARYDLAGRLFSYLGIVGAVLVVSLLLALLMSSRLQSAVTQPILAIADTAHRVRTDRNFALRVEKTTEDETGYLVDAFNGMLQEAGDRTQTLERTNRILEHEMEVRQEAEQALRVANQRKDEFLATLAHELRNPLGPIRNAVHYLRLKGPEEPDLQRTLGIIDRQIQHMVRLIEDLLDISRITRDALELRLSSFPLQDLIQDVIESTQHALDEAGHAFEVEAPQGEVLLHADRARLSQAVCNLVTNAIKYTPKAGRIRLAARARETELEIAVADNGIGIPPDKLGEIFQPFSQLDRSLEKTRGGLGIGLALTQRLVALHGGTVVARSEGADRGSEFVVTLPIVRRRGIEPAAAGDGPRPEIERQHVLVADDNHDAAESLAALLRAVGHEVSTARDGIEAFEIAGSRRFDFAVLDIGMPRLNGYELARRIRQQPWGRSMVLVALTGWGQAEDRQRSMDAGFDQHLTKPVHPDQLLRLMARSRSTS